MSWIKGNKHKLVWAIGVLIFLFLGKDIKYYFEEHFPKNSIVYMEDKQGIIVLSKGKENAYPYTLLEEVDFNDKVVMSNVTDELAFIRETYLTKPLKPLKATYTLYMTALDGHFILKKGSKVAHLQLGVEQDNEVLALFNIEGYQ